MRLNNSKRLDIYIAAPWFPWFVSPDTHKPWFPWLARHGFHGRNGDNPVANPRLFYPCRFPSSFA